MTPRDIIIGLGLAFAAVCLLDYVVHRGADAKVLGVVLLCSFGTLLI